MKYGGTGNGSALLRPGLSVPLTILCGRKSLLLGTALASTLLIGNFATPTPAFAVDCPQPPSPGRILYSSTTEPIVCINTESRVSNAPSPYVGASIALGLVTQNDGNFIKIVNSGSLMAELGPPDVGPAIGMLAVTGGFGSGSGAGAYIDIANSGDIKVNATDLGSGPNGLPAAGILGLAFGGPANSVHIENEGNIGVTVGRSVLINVVGVAGTSFAPASRVDIENRGDVSVALGYGNNSIVAALGSAALGPENQINIINESSNLKVALDDGLKAQPVGIFGRADYAGSSIYLENRGGHIDVAVAGGAYIEASGIYGVAGRYADNSSIFLVNSGGIALTGGTGVNVAGLRGVGQGADSSIHIVNSADIAASASDQAFAIVASTRGADNHLSIVNSGDLAVTGAVAAGMFVQADGVNSDISIANMGDIGAAATSGGMGLAVGVFAQASHGNVAIKNSGDISVDSLGRYAGGIVAMTYGDNSTISIVNSGAITASHAPLIAAGIYSHTYGTNSGIAIENRGNLQATGLGKSAGILARATGPNSPVSIVNSGSVYGGYAGIFASSLAGTQIVNTGNISAGSQLAINVGGASAEIYNAGHITGFVVLDADDTFINQSGGVFETKLASDFGPGSDLFRNEGGGTVLAATDPGTSEHSSFVNLERFENHGLITMQDGQAGDSFEISNTVGGRDLKFVASGDSTLGVDAFLGGPGSISDTFTINGDASGKTLVDVNNTNRGPGVLNTVGIPVVYVNGNVNSDAFYLNKPIDTGFFNYDLFFRPTGSGVFELKSFLGQGAFVLPQLETAAQDLWHEGSSTWFDRTADLRVLLNGGAAPAEDPNAKYADGTPASPNITPAVWVRAAGSSLDRDVSANVTAYDRDYSYNLNRNLESVDFQGGIDLGKRGLLSENDILVFGALGGFVHSNLDYDAINRLFQFEGGQVGGYATYLRGGLFVDTLLDVHLLQIDTKTLGFPNSLDTTTVGLRTDSGYRFGSFRGGAFIEPLATISLTWADINSFTQGGNKVSFNDDPNVRGRLGLRVGTSMPVWAGTTMEPFVIGSLWGNLSDNNEATLVSTDTTFHLQDQLEDVWGEVSAGVNFFNPSAHTSVFAKADVTFGDNIDGIGGKAGIRVSW